MNLYIINKIIHSKTISNQPLYSHTYYNMIYICTQPISNYKDTNIF